MKKIALAFLMLVSSQAFAVDTAGVQRSKKIGADSSTTGQVSPNNTAPAGAGVGGDLVLPAIVQSALPTYSTNGNFVGLTVDGSGRLYVTIDSTVTVGTNLKQVNGSALSATNPVFVQQSDGAATYTGTKTGQLPAALGATTKSASVSVALATDTGTLAVAQGAPTGNAFARGTPASIANGATTAITCKSSLTISQPIKVYRVRVNAFAAARCTIRYNNNTAFTNFSDLMTNPTTGYGEITPPAAFWSVTAGASGTQAIEANCNNVDALNDFSCDVDYCQAASGC